MKSTILYVEDNALNMRLVRKIVTSLGYDMIEAPNGSLGMMLASTEMPSLILVDINLPDMDGLEVTRRLKADSRTAHIPIVALTANAMHGDRERCYAAGCDGYIAKPVGRQELRQVLVEFLNRPKSTASASA